METVAMWIGLTCALVVLVCCAVMFVYALYIIIKEHK